MSREPPIHFEWSTKVQCSATRLAGVILTQESACPDALHHLEPEAFLRKSVVRWRASDGGKGPLVAPGMYDDDYFSR